MTQPRVMILRAPGTNCDHETAFAFERAGARVERVHVNRLLDEPAALDAYQVLCIPGGFSYGDDVAAGRILANQLRHHMGDRLRRFRDQDKLILGICNGFQVLLKSGVLFDNEAETDLPATLTWNDSGRFEDRWVHLRVEPSDCVLFAGIRSMYLPVAHAEGKFAARGRDVLDDLRRQRRVIVRYAAADGGEVTYPANPNGSEDDVAGVCDTTGRVCGLMPHPERYIQRTQHPKWTRSDLPEAGDGLRVFENAVRYFA